MIKDLYVLYRDYVKNCKSLNIIPLCMIKWYDKFYGDQNKNHQCKKNHSVDEVIEEINKIRVSGIY